MIHLKVGAQPTHRRVDGRAELVVKDVLVKVKTY